MASSEVDQKFLGKLARAVEPNNALLASMLFKILGLSINLAAQLVKARKQRRLDTTRPTQSLELYFHIIWLSREGLVMLEQYVLPMVGDYVELKVLAYKLRASFYHIFVLFHNHPSVSAMTPEALAAAAAMAGRLDKERGLRETIYPKQPGPHCSRRILWREGLSTHHLALDIRPQKQEAVALADSLLWGSHSLRLSVRTEYAAFLYECVHDAEGSRKFAKDTIAEVYQASEGMDDDMFNDACELVTVLGKMMKRGLGSSNPSKSRGDSPATVATSQNDSVATAIPAAGMENPI
ncbi:hypothetical protein PG985_013331 [Apiospora marii]|uniref:uncharacterized protein n=1 Tax=Apiospora marii TaxID=335849 RepID=UPI003131F7CA